jgi:phosphoribosylformylglycinamidine cyclo-ligase
VRGCKATGCALIGGEMAEMPGFYQTGEYDVAGSITGIVEYDKIVDGSRIRSGDKLIGLPSNGLHTNGYSLARKVLFEHAGFNADSSVSGLRGSVGENLLAVHRCYLPVVEALPEQLDLRGMSHITGGGIEGNTRRILPRGLSLNIQWDAWQVPPIFQLIQETGNVPVPDMRRTFNLGVGFVFIVSPDQVNLLIQSLADLGERPVLMGEVK